MFGSAQFVLHSSLAQVYFCALLFSDFYWTGVCFSSGAGACFCMCGGVLSWWVFFPAHQVFLECLESFPYMYISQHAKSAPVFLNMEVFFSVWQFFFLSSVGKTLCNGSYGMHRLDQLAAIVLQMLDAAAALS